MVNMPSNPLWYFVYNILRLDEGLQWPDKSKQTCLFLTLDFDKAYDISKLGFEISSN